VSGGQVCPKDGAKLHDDGSCIACDVRKSCGLPDPEPPRLETPRAPYKMPPRLEADPEAVKLEGKPKDPPKLARGEGGTPLVAGHGYARRFPLEALPEPMAAYAQDLAVRKQVPVDLTALTLLGALGSVAGPRILIRRDLDWIQPTNIYTCCGLGSSGGKSPAVAEIRQGMQRARGLLAERHQMAVAKQIAQLEQEGEALLARANDVHTPIEERDRLRHAAKLKVREREGLEAEPPSPPELVLDGDTTPEALADTMAGNQGCGPVIDDEGTLLRNIGGQTYGDGKGGKAGNLGLLLVGYDCRYFRPKRTGRVAGSVERAALSLVLSPQPGLVASMLRNSTMNELGLINRFIVSVPGDLLGLRAGRPSTYYRDAPAERPDLSGRRWWSALVERLVARYDIIGSEDAEEGAATIDLTREAWKRHYEYSESLERRCHPATGDLRKVAPWAAKHAGRVLRIAALLHLAHGLEVGDELTEQVMEQAIAIGDWAIEHFLHAEVVAGLSEEAGRIKEYVDGTQLGFATRTELFRNVFKGHASAAALSGWIEELVAEGDYEVVSIGTGGRPSVAVRRKGVEHEAAA